MGFSGGKGERLRSAAVLLYAVCGTISSAVSSRQRNRPLQNIDSDPSEINKFFNSDSLNLKIDSRCADIITANGR